MRVRSDAGIFARRRVERKARGCAAGRSRFWREGCRDEVRWRCRRRAAPFNRGSHRSLLGRRSHVTARREMPSPPCRTGTKKSDRPVCLSLEEWYHQNLNLWTDLKENEYYTDIKHWIIAKNQFLQNFWMFTVAQRTWCRYSDPAWQIAIWVVIFTEPKVADCEQ